MYTQCPECQTAFRATAKLLQQAGGKVRCSGCNAAFNALDFLSEEPPPSIDIRIRTSDVLQSLEELAGPDDILIEDTGVEWQVHEKPRHAGIPQDADRDRQTQGQLDLPDTARDSSASGELRFDDNTPLPDEFGERSAGAAQSDADSPSTSSDDAVPMQQDVPHEDLELGEPDDWQDLLQEVGADSLEVQVLATQARPEAAEEPDVVAPADDPTISEEPDAGVLAGELDDDSFMAVFAAAPSEPTSMQQEAPREVPETTFAGVPMSLLEEDHSGIESIVMEGDTIIGSTLGSADELQARDCQIDIPEATQESYTLQRIKIFGGRRKTDPPGIAVIGGAILLVLLLGAQLVHAHRQYLATFAPFNRTAGSVYRLFGHPVNPEWNIRGWQFESTRGATGENEGQLTILSRIANASERPLPYPLIHVALTDRWEEIIGSRVLEPNAYLAGDLDPSRPVAAGENFTAVIDISSPSLEATGFKLNVCYRVSPGRIRCAIDDFKN